MSALERNAGRIALGLVALAFVLRVSGQVGRGLWFDEIWTLVDFGRLSLGTLLTTYGSDNNHPLYSISAWFCLQALGETAFALRLPAVLFGTASVWATWVLARRVASAPVALLTVGLLAISYHHVWFSQNARGYTALLFFTVASSHFFLRALDGDKRAFVGHGVLLALATYTHLTGVFVAFGHLAAFVVDAIQRRRRGEALELSPIYGLALGTGASLLLHATILQEMITFLLNKSATAAGSAKAPVPKPKSEWQSPLWTVKAVIESFGFGLVPGLVGLLGGGFVFAYGAWRWLKADLRLVAIFLVPGLAGAAVMVGMGRNLWPRFFFFLASFLLLIVVRGALDTAALVFRGAWVGRVQAAGAAVLVLGSLAILPKALVLPKQDFEGAQAWLEAQRGPRDAVVTLGLARMPYARYFGADFTPVDSIQDIERVEAGAERVWMVHTLPVYLTRFPELAAYVDRRGREVKRFRGSVGGGDLVVFSLE